MVPTSNLIPCAVENQHSHFLRGMVIVEQVSWLAIFESACVKMIFSLEGEDLILISSNGSMLLSGDGMHEHCRAWLY